MEQRELFLCNSATVKSRLTQSTQSSQRELKLKQSFHGFNTKCREKSAETNKTIYPQMSQMDADLKQVIPGPDLICEICVILGK